MIRKTLTSLALIGVTGAAIAVASFGGAAYASPTTEAIPGVENASILVACTSNGADETHTGAQILARGKLWITEKVPYSQTNCHKNVNGTYRQDCSGFVSMAWGLKDSHWTGNILDVSKKISKSSMKPGDAFWVHNSSHQHMGLFVKWVGAAGGAAIVYEESSSGTNAHQSTWSASRVAEFTALRYNHFH
ncbi:hypothetical protein Lfu02_66440 [Longispora fulva]|uniref:NlpC/P60 domain-containing protein n=1 Tax=Longispora fulva TaxID=619741 RepID=A0A8J7KM11_9ACTN|nr:NlpC/P60 family protein [Longispora fulva]MBG6138621.1 hypothetical protein [Longispora fulva]GIG62272.1 hypothetical protein Lfu02_66440 [Longispora fulva]